MIPANVAAAETLERAQAPLIYRVHDEPSRRSSTRCASSSRPSASVRQGQVLRPVDFNRVLARVRRATHEQLVNEVVLRSQAQAEYSAENYGHFGLNLRRYAHFTSPIRRYADLIVHRALIRALELGQRRPAETTTRRAGRDRRSTSRPPSAAPWWPSARPPTG